MGEFTVKKFAEALLGKEEGQKVIQEARDNHQRLLHCAVPHDFELVDTRPSKARCKKCGGIISGSAMTWYNRGLRHAGIQKNPYHCEDCGKLIDADNPEEAAWSGPDGATVVCLECEPDWRKPSDDPP